MSTEFKSQSHISIPTVMSGRGNALQLSAQQLITQCMHQQKTQCAQSLSPQSGGTGGTGVHEGPRTTCLPPPSGRLLVGSTCTVSPSMPSTRLIILSCGVLALSARTTSPAQPPTVGLRLQEKRTACSASEQQGWLPCKDEASAHPLQSSHATPTPSPPRRCRRFC